MMQDDSFTRFSAGIDGADALAAIRAGLIGDGIPVPGPFGTHPLVYADYVASGRALRQVEDFVRDEVLPWYANSHTEASYCGARMTRMRRAARQVIADCTGATDEHAVIFSGAGATSGLNRLVHLLGVADAVAAGDRPVIFIGPYEHHSNILPWRESGADVIEIAEAEAGGPCLAHLHRVLAETSDRNLRIAAFSAASNVTGILTDTVAITGVLRAHGVMAVWDYAGGAPYLEIDMASGQPHAKDAIVLSGHKFPGGPGASGVLILRHDAIRARRPSLPGGGTVRFVSPWGHDYSDDPASREEAGTPDVVGDIRAALVFLVKRAIGQSFLDRRHAELAARGISRWAGHPAIELLGSLAAPRLPILSFRVRNLRDGGFIHQQLFTRMLSDRYGIQARGGCACAGPYAHRLLGIGAEDSGSLRSAILAGEEVAKPGWTRLNLSALMTDDKIDFILSSVADLAADPHPDAARYLIDPATARFHPLTSEAA